MKVTREQLDENRRRIVQAAARLFREHGPGRVSIAQVTQAAGLTHGAFYGHFSSKEALLAEACRTAFGDAAALIQRARVRDGDLSGYVRSYLANAHVADAGSGCPIVALAAEMPHQDEQTRQAFAVGLRECIDAASGSERESRPEAITTLATIVGAVLMARALAGTDQRLATELLRAVRARECAR